MTSLLPFSLSPRSSEFFQFTIARLFVITTAAAARGAHQPATAVAPQLGVILLGHFIFTVAARPLLHRAPGATFQLVDRHVGGHRRGAFLRPAATDHHALQRRARVLNEPPYADQPAQRRARARPDLRHIVHRGVGPSEPPLEQRPGPLERRVTTAPRRGPADAVGRRLRPEPPLAQLSRHLPSQVQSTRRLRPQNGRRLLWRAPVERCLPAASTAFFDVRLHDSLGVSAERWKLLSASVRVAVDGESGNILIKIKCRRGRRDGMSVHEELH